jgi:transposase
LIEHEQTVRSLVSARPDLTISDLRNELAALGINVGRSSVGRFLQRLQLTFKKNSARRRTATA